MGFELGFELGLDVGLGDTGLRVGFPVGFDVGETISLLVSDKTTGSDGFNVGKRVGNALGCCPALVGVFNDGVNGVGTKDDVEGDARVGTVAVGVLCVTAGVG